ncbi:hypothetical protein Tco_0682418 [Tanacetum coccineum]|uniref:Retrovirus-related Pol polyprotein from transposon TNT 1-94 n=1 Tax=Tanacetum coccineum TaxID=301880 RepID=A0ABQ4XSH3_9ASTR
MIASSSSRNSSKNMSSFSLNDMVHNHYLEEAKKKTQERNKNLKSSVMHTASPQTTTKGSKPKSRSNNQTPRSLPVSKSSCVTIMVVPKEITLRILVLSQIPNTLFVLHVISGFQGERYSLLVQARITENPYMVQMKIFLNIHEYKQTLDLSAGTSLTSQQKQRIDFSEEVPAADMIIMTSMIELESLFDPLFDEYFNGDNQVVSKSSVVTTADASDKPFSDSDHAGCLDSRKSTSGGIQFLGGDKLVSWSSKKHDCTSMSSAEAEYVSLSTCCAQVLWLRTQLTDYGFHFDKIPMYYDSKASIAISCNPVADLFTKALSEDRFKYLVRRLGMICLAPEELEIEFEVLVMIGDGIRIRENVPTKIGLNIEHFKQGG